MATISMQEYNNLYGRRAATRSFERHHLYVESKRNLRELGDE